MFMQRKPDRCFVNFFRASYFDDSFRFYNKRVAADQTLSIHTGIRKMIIYIGTYDDNTKRKSSMLPYCYYYYLLLLLWTHTMLNM